jgi:hypothetical protein
MFVVSAVFFFTRGIYFTSIFLSWLSSIAAMIVLAWRVARSEIGAAFAVFALTLSRSVVAYSTCGLCLEFFPHLSFKRLLLIIQSTIRTEVACP